jgi:uncharacterized protein (TIGR03437 family)
MFMISRSSCRFLLMLAVATLPAAAQIRNIYVVPPLNDASRTVPVLNPESFQPVATVQAGQDAYAAFIQPSAPGKVYLLSRSATSTVTVINPAFATAATLNVPGGSSDGVLSPDGRRLVLVSANSPTITFIDTSSDQITLTLPLAAPAISIAVNFESSRAFVLSPSNSTLTTFDLNNFQQVNSVVIPSEVTNFSGVTYGPNGLVYVSSVNRIYEIDPRNTPAITRPSGFPFTGSPFGRPQVTLDGTRAVLANATPIAGGSSLILFDLTGNQPPQIVNLQGITINDFRLTSANTGIGYSRANNLLYNITLTPFAATPAQIPGIPNGPIISGIGASTESPTSRYAFVVAGSAIYRIDVAASQVTAQIGLNNPNGGTPLWVAQPSSSTTTVTNLQVINGNQFVLPNTVSLPLVVRALDINGNPVAGVQITWSSQAQEAPVQFATTTTNSQGYAQNLLTTPNRVTQFGVVASIPGVATQVFAINVGQTNNPGTGGSGQVAIFDGNGQIARSQAPTAAPMRVRVTDAQGTPLTGVVVTWNITGGTGQLSLASTPGGATGETQTDGDGIASNTFIGGLLFASGASFIKSTVTASTTLGSATFTQITVPALVDTRPDSPPANLPSVRQIVPAGPIPEIVANLGQTLRGAFQYEIRASSGPFVLQPIDGVGISAFTDKDAATGPTARCSGNSVSDDKGIVTCDLTIGGRVGAAILTVSVGGVQNFTYELRATPGSPARIRALSGSGQRGISGRTLPQAFVAQLDDGFGNAINGAEVEWRIVQGSGTLVQTFNRSGSALIPNPQATTAENQFINANGIVSSGFTLGNTPGDTRVRVQLRSTPSVFAEFTVTTDVSFGSLRLVSGNSQSAIVNRAFANPLVVEVLATNGSPLPNTQVSFAGSGITLSASVVSTDNLGRAQVTATAGATVGPASVQASVAASNLPPVTFSLTVLPLGPTITAILNGASLAADTLSPCATATMQGTNIAPGVTGTLNGESIVRTWANTLNSSSIQFGSITAPISSITNANGQESIVFQIPCEAAPGSATVTLRTGQQTTTQQVTIRQVGPGIYEQDEQGTRYALVQRPNGSFVSASNRAVRGERLRAFVNGLGLTNPAVVTNGLGTGNQRVLADLVVGVNFQGVQVEEAFYAQGFLGLWTVTFTLPTASPAGNVPFNLAATGSNGETVFSNVSAIPVQ